MKGYMGKLLRVDLTTRHIMAETLAPQFARDFIGGAGLGIRLAYNEIPPETDPLGPGAKLMIMTGPVTATALGSAGRFEVVFKSPLTGILCDSSSGGHWGSEFKLAGYDGVILQGAAATPVYLYVADGHAELRDASHLWGMDAYAVQDVLRTEVGDTKARVLCIGPAGEREVLYACMVNDAGRMPGRGGAGAVMGHMKLKAIVVRGTGRVELAEPAAFRQYAVGVNKTNATSPQVEGLRVLGTPRVMDNNWPLSDIPTKNFALGSQEAMCVSLGGKKMKATILVPHVACHRCSMGCSRWVRVPEGPYTMDAPGPEFETLGALGSNCMIDDLEFVSYAAHLCNIYGMDTLSCGGTIAFAMECFEKGLLTADDTGGIELTFGNKDAMLAAIRQIAFGEGFGRLLALGSRKLAERIGRGSGDFAVQIKGLELPMHDARAFFGWGATYATGPRGGCHLHGMSSIYEGKDAPLPEWDLNGNYPRHSDEHKGKIARLAQNWAHILNSMAICYFYSFTQRPSDLCALINGATGSELTPESLLVIGDRINALHRAYNYRCGIRRADDRFPPARCCRWPRAAPRAKCPMWNARLTSITLSGAGSRTASRAMPAWLNSA
jgi:aldehyde:ferredoxin oxidoreductase